MTGQACKNSGIFTVFHSIRRPYITIKLPPRYEHASTPTQSVPITGQRNMQLPPSLEWHVWSSSSGNNCHAVHRSPSFSALVCDCTVGFEPCSILSAKLYFTSSTLAIMPGEHLKRLFLWCNKYAYTWGFPPSFMIGWCRPLIQTNVEVHWLWLQLRIWTFSTSTITYLLDCTTPVTVAKPLNYFD